jgi:hypothetical protein
MRKFITIAATSAVVLAATTTASVSAKAGDGGAVAAGIIGGLTLGAILGSAAPHPVYGPPVAIGPVYDGPPCYWAPGRPYWDGYEWVRPRVRMCD